MRTFAIVNQKGGCGKTTTAINLAAAYARRGLRTLLVDVDPQSHCAVGLGVPERKIDRSVADAMLAADDDHLDASAFVWEVAGNLDLIPSSLRLAGLEAPGGGLHELPDRDRRLARLLKRFAEEYDRCLIDCPCTIGLLTFNALRAAREALIPVETGFFALRGADKQFRTIRQLIERLGRPIACHLLPTLYDEGSTLAVNILASLRRQFAGLVVPVVVHEDEVVREAASFGQPVIEYAPGSRARDDFEALVDWLEEHPPRPILEIEVFGGSTPGVEAPAETGAPVEATVGVGPSLEPTGRAAELARRVRGLNAAAPEAAETAVARETAVAPCRAPEASCPATTLALRYGAAAIGGGVRFAQPGTGRQKVSVAGDFNHWSVSATPLHWDSSLSAHQAVVRIPPGTYRYRLVVDGHWHADPYNADQQLNEYDELNSVLVVPESQDGPP